MSDRLRHLKQLNGGIASSTITNDDSTITISALSATNNEGDFWINNTQNNRVRLCLTVPR